MLRKHVLLQAPHFLRTALNEEKSNTTYEVCDVLGSVRFRHLNFFTLIKWQTKDHMTYANVWLDVAPQSSAMLSNPGHNLLKLFCQVESVTSQLGRHSLISLSTADVSNLTFNLLLYCWLAAAHSVVSSSVVNGSLTYRNKHCFAAPRHSCVYRAFTLILIR